MKKIKKGDYGYRNHFKRKQLFIIALLALFIIAQLVGRSFTDNDSVKKILTVMAIVTVLPAANLASPLIAIFKYHTPEQAFHEAYMPYEEKFEVLYDLVLTTPEDVIPSDGAFPPIHAAERAARGATIVAVRWTALIQS